MSDDADNLVSKLLEGMEQADQCVAFMTGLKAKFVAAGWSDTGAELSVLTMLNQGAKFHDS